LHVHVAHVVDWFGRHEADRSEPGVDSSDLLRSYAVA
jgi:hypothetical protein